MNSLAATSALFVLMNQHQDADAYYQKAAEEETDAKLRDYLLELAAFRKKLGEEAYRLLDDMAPSPMPMYDQEKMRSYFHRHWDSVQEAILRKDTSKLLELVRLSEEANSAEYREVLKTPNLAGGIADRIDEQHRLLLRVLKTTERYQTVPQIRPGSLEI